MIRDLSFLSTCYLAVHCDLLDTVTSYQTLSQAHNGHIECLEIGYSSWIVEGNTMVMVDSDKDKGTEMNNRMRRVNGGITVE